MENTPTIKTPRLLLRRFTLEDAPAYYAYIADPAVNRFLPQLPPASVAEAAGRLRTDYLDAYREPRGFRYAICLRDGPVIGNVNVGLTQGHDLGYALARAYWGQGLAVEAAGAVLDAARRAGLPFATATHDVHNPASGRVMEKLRMGYRYTYRELWEPKGFRVTFRMYQIALDGTDETYMGYWRRYPEHWVETEL